MSKPMVKRNITVKYATKHSNPKKYLTEHKQIHREPEEYSCKKCPKVFCSKSALRGHVKTKHESTSYTCEYCNKNFERAFCLKQHIDSCQKKIAYQLNQRKHSEITCEAKFLDLNKRANTFTRY